MIEPLRHMSVFSPQRFGDKEINVIGAGATGSKLVMELAKLGCENIHVWDFDTIESHNIANQLFGNQHIGMPKVEALQSIVKEYTGTEITIHNEEVVDQPLSGIVFLLTDTMSSRKEIWENCIKFKLAIELMVETRMGVDNGRIYTINPKSLEEIKMWENTLVDDDVAEVSSCGSSISVGPTSSILAGWAVWQMIRWHDILSGQSEDMLEHEIIFALRSTYTMSRTA